MLTLRIAHKDPNLVNPAHVQYIEAKEVAFHRHAKEDEDDVISFTRADGTEDTYIGLGHVLVINADGKAIDTYHFKYRDGRCRV